MWMTSISKIDRKIRSIYLKGKGKENTTKISNALNLHLVPSGINFTSFDVLVVLYLTQVSQQSSFMHLCKYESDWWVMITMHFGALI